MVAVFGLFDLDKAAADPCEPEIAVRPTTVIGAGKKADRGPNVVETGDLCLRRTGEVFGREIRLTEGR